MKKFIAMHIHHHFASLSSRDVMLYKECKRKPKDVVSTFGDEDILVYKKTEKKFYDEALQTNKPLCFEPCPLEWKKMIEKYKKQGFKEGTPIEISDYFQRERVRRDIRREEQGFVILGEFPYPKEIYKGFLSTLITTHPHFIQYTSSGNVWGYFGHGARRKIHDIYISKHTTKNNVDEVIEFLCHKKGRWMMDKIEESSTDDESYKIIDDYMSSVLFREQKAV